MARINLLDTRTTTFGELIGNGKIYQVPSFQRDYSWNEENWEDLWQDILVLHTNSNSSHYMGAVVLQNSGTSDKEFTIIDGQQRLATLSIIAIAVLKQIQNLVDREQQKEENQERQDILRRTYLSDKDPRSLRYSSKIILNENNNDFYQSNLINLTLNRQVGNEIYSIKREVYQQSVYQLTQNIETEEWTPNALTTRQRHLAQRAIHVWRSDFQ
ncbi:DUF262 domain-containing HNH endonuclease family protein [Spirulina subsalsa FACHB-351]|uniref:DUF262 domain-containing HNH endonuclease family protein n=1 Tax=Spirulina subsalsa FACHB-351 TaxID=234711 RepID=A0ABT3L7X1_9CYAN|nr:DUF262 domain-containing protein [Spirulina subsalsa]MCW6037589.1 DUF262 domain-containing HNH endonuclease family protein [Spirulina subsalsa FACHB-351]